jgi:hypothetical protein
VGDPRILLLDLECIPDLNKALRYWTKLSSFPGKTLKASVASICCMGWKIFGEEETHCINAWDFPEWETDVNNDRPLLEAFLPELMKADAIMTHNGRRFDKKFIQTRLLLSGAQLAPDSPHIDTKVIASSNFSFIDNKLQTIGEELFNAGKVEHEGWNLWVRVHGGIPRKRDLEAEAIMTNYCKGDIDLLEKVYRKFRPVAKGVPNHNLFSPFKVNVCPKCGGSRLKSEGMRTTATRRYRRYYCLDCGSPCHTDLKDELPR